METGSVEEGSRFLASTLHEIRTPIQTIIGTIELLQDTQLDQEQTEYARQIEFSANVLLQLANDVLDFTKIKSNEFKLENMPFDVRALTEQVVDLVAIEAFNKGIEVAIDIDYSIPHTFMGDPVRIQQIILNLAKNAVKFTDTGYVLIKVNMEDGLLHIEIADSGIGIDADKRELIFKDYYQVNGTSSRKYGGTGLGLSICKNLVQAMHGQIGVKENKGRGSIFWFSLPLEVPQSSPFDEDPFFENPPSDKILVVDDNSLAVNTLVRKMNSLGLHDIITARNGQEALEVLKECVQNKTPVKIAFIDMVMPAMDGWRLASLIREDPQLRTMKLYLAVPEGQMGKDAKMKMLHWFNGYIYKPMKRELLFNTLTQAFSQTESDVSQVEELDIDPEELKDELPSLEAVDTTETTPHAENTTARTAAQPDPDSQLVKGCKVLVAEDHPVNRKLMDTFLKKYGAEVYVAEDGLQAVNAISQNKNIDLIFMDIQMPVKDGKEATIELRRSGYNGIIVACTANNNAADFAEYKKIGMNDILIKPFKREAVRQILEKWSTVLSFPEAKSIVALSDINNNASQDWDIADFMNTAGNDKELAVSIMNDYMEQTQNLLEQVKEQLSKPLKDFDTLHRLAHTLKGSSATISARKLSEYGRQMDEAAKIHDTVAMEAARTDFAIDFIEFGNIVKSWKNNL